MQKIVLTTDELHYINADVDDNRQEIYRKFNHLNSNFYLCATLPQGTYTLDIEDKENCYMELAHFDVDAYTTNTGVEFRINKPTKIMLYLDDVMRGVLDLRRQVVENRRTQRQERERLVQKAINKHTYLAIDPKNKKHDFGMGYNARSMHETVEECLDEDITIELDESKPVSDLYVRYLRAMKLKQEMERLVSYELSLSDAEHKLSLLIKEVEEKQKLINDLNLDIAEKKRIIEQKDLEVENRQKQLLNR